MSVEELDHLIIQINLVKGGAETKINIDIDLILPALEELKRFKEKVEFKSIIDYTSQAHIA